jgi:hypothetical protein
MASKVKPASKEDGAVTLTEAGVDTTDIMLVAGSFL